jgi:hypothetical protein
MTLYAFYVKANELRARMQTERRESIERRNNRLRTGIIIKELDEK